MRRMSIRCLMVAALFLIAGTIGVVAGASTEDDSAPVSDGPRMGGTLNVGLHIPFATLDWQATVQHPAPQVQNNVWEGLTAYGKDFTAVPELAESYEASEGGRVWTFHLREGVLFHNLKEMTSADVKASVERWLRVGPKGQALQVDSIETPDDYTVVMHFPEPLGQTLLILLGSDENKCVIMPKEVVDASPEANKLSEIVGTGPYKWTEYVEDQFIRLTRFEEYVSRDDAPNYQSGAKVAYLDEIIYWIVPETATRVAGLETGEYDVIIEVPVTEFDLLDRAEGFDPIKTGPGFNFYLMFNHQNGLTKDINFRRAVQAAIDAEEVIAAAIPDPEFSTLGGSFYPPESAYHNDAREELYNQADPEKAREYLEAAGYNGEPVTYQVIATNPQMVRIGVAVVEQLKAAGMNAEVLSYDLQTWVSKRRDGNALMMYNSGGNWIDPSLYQPEFSGTFPSEETGFQHDDVDRVFEALNRETDLERRIDIGAELQTLFYDLVATYNFGYRYRLVAKRDYVMDPEGNLALGNLTLNNIWLNK